jgi:hypothetical protein
LDWQHQYAAPSRLARSRSFDWTLLASFTPNKLARNALETHLVALFSLLAVDVPARMRTRLIPRLQHRRRLAQARLPLLRQAPLPIAILDYQNYREGLGASNKKGTIVGDRKWPKSDTLAAVASRERRAGKV